MILCNEVIVLSKNYGIVHVLILGISPRTFRKDRIMSSGISAHCPECGKVSLRRRDIWIRTCLDTSRSTYHFRCSVCMMVCAKNANDASLDILTRAGVRTVFWRLPAELRERTGGDPITDTDLMTFSSLLQTPGWFEKMIEITNLSGIYVPGVTPMVTFVLPPEYVAPDSHDPDAPRLDEINWYEALADYPRRHNYLNDDSE